MNFLGNNTSIANGKCSAGGLMGENGAYRRGIFSCVGRSAFLGVFLVVAAVLAVSCGSTKSYSKVTLKNDIDTASYFLGYHHGIIIFDLDFYDLNTEAYVKGMLDAMKVGAEWDDYLQSEQFSFLNDFGMKLIERQNQKFYQEGIDFLEANKVKPNVVTLPSGLQYKIIREGAGIKPPGMDDAVEVMFHGTLIDGTVFDSAKERGYSAIFEVSEAIAGLAEALKLMTEGAIWEIYIPSELGWGIGGAPKIKPYSVLIFEIELIRVIAGEPED